MNLLFLALLVGVSLCDHLPASSSEELSNKEYKINRIPRSETLRPDVSLLSPRGIRFVVKDATGQTLVAVHYSINTFISGVNPGDYNYDISKKTGNVWIHENRNIHIKPTDTVYFWIYATRNGRGYQLLEQSWKPSTVPTTPRFSSTATSHVTTRPVTYPPRPTPTKPDHGCPDDDPRLKTWRPGNNPNLNVIIRKGTFYRLEASAALKTITIEEGGKLVFGDRRGPITLKVEHIMVRGEFYIGSEKCLFQDKANIILRGKSTDSTEVPNFGRKFIGVDKGGLLEIHGEDKASWTFLTSSVPSGSKNPVLKLADDVTSWRPGDRIVLASTDYDMEQAEEFDLQPCSGCSNRQVKIRGDVKYTHFGAFSDGVDMRGEVGLLSRNVLIKGEMESRCYGNNQCRFFKYDTFGGHIIIMMDHKSVHLSGIELTNMGQQLLARYPIHFHLCDDVDQRGGYTKPAYVKKVSIHHCFNRCITIHRTDGLLVQDTVGYDTLGHCFFLEDGAEQRNTLDHNLGLVTRAGTVIPTDRNDDMCKNIRDKAWPGYIPDINQCNAVSTFWLAHPNNNMMNNSAAGSEKVGIWFIFHMEPTGHSVGKLPRFHGNRSPLGKFINNRVHGNYRNGFMIDFGVKITPASAREPQEQLSVWGGLYEPHVDSDLKKPRAPAIIDGLVVYKNREGSWVRGGDIFYKNCQFADNGLGLTFASAGEIPYDADSHQEIRNSIFVGESDNVGTNSPGNKHWDKGADGRYRTMPQIVSHPYWGFRIYDGPILVHGCTFRKFANVGRRKTMAIGFFLTNPFQMTPLTTFSSNKFDDKTNRIFMGAPGEFFGKNDMDGDKTAIIHDVDGSITGKRKSYVVKPDNYLAQNAGCLVRKDWNGAVCTGKNLLMFVYAHNPGGMKMTLLRDDYSDKPLTLKGLGRTYMPVMMATKSYSMHWSGRAPADLTLRMTGWDRGDYLRIGLCYPPRTTFRVTYRIQHRPSSNKLLTKVNSIAEVDRSNGNVYYWDASSGLLFLKMLPRESREGWNYCSVKGCEEVNIAATMTSVQVSDCRRRAYPKYSLTPSQRDLFRQ